VERSGQEIRNEGRTESKIEAACAMKKEGFQDNLIAKILKEDIDVVKGFISNPSAPPQ